MSVNSVHYSVFTTNVAQGGFLSVVQPHYFINWGTLLNWVALWEQA